MLKSSHYISLSFLTIFLISCGLVVLDGSITKNKLLTNSDFAWREDSSQHFKYYYEKGTWADRNIDSLKVIAERSFKICLQLIQRSGYTDTINYFIVESRERMDDLIYRRTNGMAFANANIVCVIASDSIKAIGAHEIFHIISIRSLGATQRWISEGFAVYSDNSWWKQDLHALASYFKNHGKIVPLKELTTKFGTFDEMISYPQAGSFIKYLYETYDFNDVHILWIKGLNVFCQLKNISVEELEKNWLSTIDRYSAVKVNYIPLNDEQ